MRTLPVPLQKAAYGVGLTLRSFARSASKLSPKFRILFHFSILTILLLLLLLDSATKLKGGNGAAHRSCEVVTETGEVTRAGTQAREGGRRAVGAGGVARKGAEKNSSRKAIAREMGGEQ